MTDRIARMIADLNAAGLDPLKLGLLYAEWIGHDPIDSGDETAVDVRDTLRDYLREECFAAGRPCVKWAD